MPDGRPVDVLTLTGTRGIEARVITYGSIIVSLHAPDRAGHAADVVLGHEDLEGYLRDRHYLGAVIGRYANRIARGRFTLDGRTYVLATNDGPNHLHGGRRGFDKVVWTPSEPVEADTPSVTLTHASADGDEGYPGTLRASVTYALTEAGELVCDFAAATDRATHVNLTQHSYFNLSGAGQGDVLAHELTVEADRFTPVDAAMIPTGALAPVAGTALDFREPVAIGARIETGDERLRPARGYDHNFVLRPQRAGLVHAARLSDPASGRRLDVHTTEPGLQLYSGNLLDGGVGKSGRRYGPRSGVCLETQHFPDSPNRPEFPSTVLVPGQEYRSRTVFAFGVS